MYLPAAFQQTESVKLWELIEQYSFGLLACAAGESLEASPLPFLLDRNAGPHGTLVSHMAQANPLWRYADGEPVLVVFSGPDAYISPAWYAAENVVPTWNYVAVHARGIFEPIFDPDEILAIVDRTVQQHEATREQPWTFPRDSDFAQRLATAVVGFRVLITRLEGKWKLSQNHAPKRRVRVIAGLRESSQQEAHQLAHFMEQTLPQE